MSLTPIASFGGGSPTDAFSTPHRVSIVLVDDGGGGSVLFNGLGDNSGTHVDLKTFFGANFNSPILLKAFRALTAADVNLAEAQLVKELLVTFVSIGSISTQPYIGQYQAIAVNGVNIPYLLITGPGVSATWRVDIQFRHSTWY